MKLSIIVCRKGENMMMVYAK